MIELRNVSNHILKNIDLEIKRGELFVLLGPNGAGKTTLLDVIAGITPYEGDVFIDEKNMKGVLPEDRDIGYVFQGLFLFPHMNVYENVVFPLKLKAKKRLKERLDELIEMFELGGIINRMPNQLSGGEAQRVALARALAVEPKILLMDEPFSKLDTETSHKLRLELKRLHKKLSITALFVTHNKDEANFLADRICFIKNGEIDGFG
ncbi:ABC transporter ATP-binding protein [Hippea maritima]|uniref:Sulfate-transporting ATPase n=1 Tax=Hippea maritima (strain ATCC 700847 / DSM 10411 / MH2) TaxID=760142 RepID=F2LX55_HIPMA|nr:ABC transporter ATP-binding protein [Hippea maritima]AEA33113.1 Sulfate-transporting ATPase [Hippea maritima DSM 10411]